MHLCGQCRQSVLAATSTPQTNTSNTSEESDDKPVENEKYIESKYFGWGHHWHTEKYGNDTEMYPYGPDVKRGLRPIVHNWKMVQKPTKSRKQATSDGKKHSKTKQQWSVVGVNKIAKYWTDGWTLYKRRS
eukprot:873553-Rhodomonas_salina.1